MKVLFISSQFPYPLNAGSKIRMFNLLISYSYKHEVTLVSYIRNNEELVYLPVLKKYCKEIYTVIHNPSQDNCKKQNKFSIMLNTIFSFLPYRHKFLCSYEMKKLIFELDRKEIFDLVHLQYNGLYNNIATLINKKNRSNTFVLDLDDYESKKYLKQLKTMKFSKEKVLCFLEYLRIKYVEFTLLPKFDYYFICLKSAEVNREKPKNSLRKPVFVPNGVDVDAFVTDKVLEKENQILYLGSMSYEPNIDAVLYFYNCIWPSIKLAIPGATFVIAGKEPTSEVLNLHDGKNIIVKGYIDDVKEVFNESSLVVVPLRIGGGTRIKILESLALQKAVVSTSIGCEGLQVENGVNIMIADGPAAFSCKCIELLRDRAKRESLGINGRKLVRRKYDWKIIRQNLSRFISDIN